MFTFYRNTSRPSKSLQALALQVGAKIVPGLPPKQPIVYGYQVDKLKQYEWFKANNVPGLTFSTDKNKALEWLVKGKVVVGRTCLKGSEGKGIVLMGNPGEFKPCPVYTLYRPKKKEFRVHIFRDKVVTVLEKRKKKGTDPKETKIRNTANGYVFCRQNVIEPVGIRELALQARKVTQSDFAGVDIGYDEKNNTLFVIEVNSAPGIEGTTLIDYANAIKEVI